MRISRIFSTLILVLFWALCTKETHASHIMGADLSYVCNGNNNYTVILRLYRDCCGIDITGSVNMQTFNGCTNTAGPSFTMTMQGGSGTEVSELCPAQLSQSACASSGNCPVNPNGNPPTYPGVQAFTYTGTVTLPSQCAQWYLRYSDCCRNATINNGSANDGVGIVAMINNTNDPATGQPYCNTSVSFNTQPVPFVCLNSNFTYNNGAVDVNGDSLRYTMINPLDDSYNPIPFTGSWNANYPITTSPPNNFSFDPTTGLIAFTPPNQEVDVMAMRVDEYRNGVLIGTTMRDIQVTVFPCNISIPDQEPITNVQNGNQLDSLSVQVCPGTPLQFDIICTDLNNHNLTLTSNINNSPSAIPGAFMTQVGTGDTVIAHITWTPQPGDTGCHNFLLTAKNDDCPINGSYTRAYTICVFTKVQLLSASVTYCGTPVQLTATGGTNFTWTPNTGPNAVSNPNIYNPTVSPSNPTMYYFTSDCGTDSVFVGAAPPFTYDAGPGGTICQNGQIHLNATTDNLYAPYHFQWVPGNGLLDPVANVPNDTVPNPVASPLVTTKYYCYITGNNGCTNVDSVTVNVAGAGPNIVVQANPATVCPNDPVQLNIVTNPQSCGIAQTPCQGNSVVGQVGTGTQSFPATPTNYPTIYGHYKKSARHQFLYRQNELMAAIGSGGTIDSISFYMDDVTGQVVTMENFEIRMACTQETDLLSAWQPNTVTVFSPKNVVLPAADGWITHKLDFPYDWDGTSNLAVDICFNNATSNVLNKKMQCTPTSFASVRYSAANTDQCGNTGVPLTSVNRPNTRFNFCVSDVAGLPIAWTPSTGTNAPVPNNTINPIANPVSPQIYSVDVTAANGCHTQDFVYVYVNGATLDLLVDSISCFGANDAKIRVDHGSIAAQYSWSNGITGVDSITNLAPGNYSVTVTFPTGCVSTGTVSILQPTQLSYSANFTNILCHGANNGTITITPSGGVPAYSYQWSPAQANTSNLTGLAAGSYSVTVFDSHQCTVSASSTISEPAALTVSVVKTDASCDASLDGTATATVNGGVTNYNYQWDGTTGNSSVNGLDNGNHSVVVTDANNCTASSNFVIDTVYELHVTTSSTNASCFGVADGTATVAALNGTSPYSYLWTPSAQTVSNVTGLPAGNYTVILTDSKNCIATATTTINEPTQIVLSFNHTDPRCTGIADGTADVTAIGGAGNYVYDWAYLPGTPDNNSLTAIAAGVYDITVTDGSSCSVSANVTLLNPPSLDAQLINKTEITCANAADGSVEASVSGGTPPISFQWNNGSSLAVQNNLAPGNYSVTVSDNNGCDTSLNVSFVAPPLISVAFLNADSVSCPSYTDGQIQVSGAGGTPGSTVSYEYSTDGINFQSSEFFQGLGAGSYHLIIRDSQGCTKDTTINIYEPPKPELTILPQDSTIQLGKSLALVSSITPYNAADINFHSWSPVTGLNCADCPSPIAAPYAHTVYTLTVNYLSGCSISQTITVFVGDGEIFYVPNAFTPNGDGNNDVFTIYGFGLAKANLKIFNRWGEKVFDSQNQWHGWDGTYKGEMQAPGVYTYYVEGIYLNGKIKEKKGSVTLIR